MSSVMDAILSSPEDHQRDFRRRFRMACQLVENGKAAGVTDTGVVVQWNGAIWRVMGGDAEHPSLKVAPEISLEDVFWLFE